MSMACKCDVCDKLFEHEEGTVGVEYHLTTKVDNEGNPTSQGYEADLCPRCSALFLAFIRHSSSDDPTEPKAPIAGQDPATVAQRLLAGTPLLPITLSPRMADFVYARHLLQRAQHSIIDQKRLIKDTVEFAMETYEAGVARWIAEAVPLLRRVAQDTTAFALLQNMAHGNNKAYLDSIKDHRGRLEYLQAWAVRILEGSEAAPNSTTEEISRLRSALGKIASGRLSNPSHYEEMARDALRSPK